MVLLNSPKFVVVKNLVLIDEIEAFSPDGSKPSFKPIQVLVEAFFSKLAHEAEEVAAVCEQGAVGVVDEDDVGVGPSGEGGAGVVGGEHLGEFV